MFAGIKINNKSKENEGKIMKDTSNWQNIDMTGISEDDESIIIENEYVKYVISKTNGNVTGISDQKTGVNIKNAAADPFCYLYGSENINPARAEIKNNKIHFTFTDGTKLDFIVQTRAKYITFELDSDLPFSYKGLIFANSQMNYDLAAGETVFSGIGLSMSYNVDITYYPDAKTPSIRANLLGKSGPNEKELRGSKFAVIFAPLGEHRSIMVTIQLRRQEKRGKAYHRRECV